MHHCFIAPINYLHLIPESSKLHLLLAHLLTDKQYVSFYKERQKAGDLLILDNGAFEFKKPLEADKIFRLCDQAKLVPNWIVAPDYPFEDWTKTYNSAVLFSERYTQYFDPNTTKIFYVPQSVKGDVRGWVAGYAHAQYINHCDFIGMSILGVPNAFCAITGTEDISFNRLFATAYLNTNNFFVRKKHHYLGCSDPRELAILNLYDPEIVYSNDSSTAFWHAINQILFDSSASGLGLRLDRRTQVLELGKTKREVDFHVPYDPNVVHFISENVHWIEELLGRSRSMPILDR